MCLCERRRAHSHGLARHASAKSSAGDFDFGCCCQRRLQPDLAVVSTLTSMQDKSPEPLFSVDPSGSRSLMRHLRSEHQRPSAIVPRGLPLVAKKCMGLLAFRPFSVSSFALATRFPPMASVRLLEPTASAIEMRSRPSHMRHRAKETWCWTITFASCTTWSADKRDFFSSSRRCLVTWASLWRGDVRWTSNSIY